MRKKRKGEMNPRLGEITCKECRGYGLVFSLRESRMVKCVCRIPRVVDERTPYRDD